MVSIGWPSILVVQVLKTPLSPRVEPPLSHLGRTIRTQTHCTSAPVITVHLQEARLGLAVPTTDRNLSGFVTTYSSRQIIQIAQG